jgi:hypothetical protein
VERFKGKVMAIQGYEQDQVMVTPTGTVRVFRQKPALEDAIGSHACSLEDLACV